MDFIENCCEKAKQKQAYKWLGYYKQAPWIKYVAG